MDCLVNILQDEDRDRRTTALHKFNSTQESIVTTDSDLDRIEEYLSLVFDHVITTEDSEDPELLDEVLLCCKTTVRDRRVASLMTPRLFVRLLELAKLTNIHEDSPTTSRTLNARRAVFNITYHNKLCQAACYEAYADVNVFDELKSFQSLDEDTLSLNCKMAFLFTSVSAEMRQRVTQSDGLTVLYRVISHVIYGGEPVPAKISHGRSWSHKSGTVTLPDQRLLVCSDVFMAMFNTTLAWDRDKAPIELTEELASYFAFLRHFYRGLSLSERADRYQQTVVKFLECLINAAAMFPHQFVPEANERSKEVFGGRDVELVKRLLRQLEVEAGKEKKGDSMMMISLLSTLNKLAGVRMARKYLRREILPSLGKVTQRPEEETGHVKSKVVKLMTNVNNSISVLASELIFTICKNSTNRMIKYTGYGNAAGLFNRHGLMGAGSRPSAAADEMSADEESDTEEYKESDVDLVTAGPAKENTLLKNMTEEEREAEANKLINLIDNMHRKGVIRPGGVGEDGKVREMDIAEQLARIPDRNSESEDEENIKLDSNSFYPRNKPS